MKYTRLFPTILIFLILLSTGVQGLAVFGDDMFIKIMFEPGFEKTYDYSFTNNDGIPADYEIFPERFKGYNMEPYFTVIPNEFRDVQPGETNNFKIKFSLPDEINVSGINEARVWVRGKPKIKGGGMSATPVVGVRYQVFVLFPYKYVEWGFSMSNMNEDETKTIGITVRNYGSPDIENVYADITVVSRETNATVALLTTNSASLSSQEEVKLETDFDSTGLSPGNYEATAVLHFDEKTEERDAQFKIGTMDVIVVNFTKEFEKESINKMDIIIQSKWNTHIGNIFAKVTVANKTGKRVREFKSVNTELDPWKRATLESYFDTKNLPLGEYDATVSLQYNGAETVVSDTVFIKDFAATEKIERVPFSFNSGLFTSTNLLILILIVFVIVNLVLAARKKSADSRVSDSTIDHLKSVIKKNDLDKNKLKDMLQKKGWENHEIDEIIRRVF